MSDRARNFAQRAPRIIILVARCAEVFPVIISYLVFLMHNPSGYVLRHKII